MTATGGQGRWGTSLVVGIAAAVGLAAIGLFASRPDLAALGLPFAVSAALLLARGADGGSITITVDALPAADGEVATAIRITGEAEAAELLVVQSQRRSRRVLVPVGGTPVVARSRVLHSGPLLAVQAAARGIAGDGAVLFPASDPVKDRREIPPALQRLERVPVPRTLTGMHGAHPGRRPGHGGDYRDIRVFVPGDELRRVDWRATARLARRPGELLVRRYDSLSEASVVIAMDTTEDLGVMVALWGSGDFERSGTTSLDRARQAARAIAAAAVAAGDRVALHVLVYGGRTVRSGSGVRHLAKLERAIAAIGQAGEGARFRRTPHVPHGSVIFVLSAFFDGAAVQTALMWRVAGHRVVAVDVLPELDRSRLSRQQLIALRVVLAERENVFSALRGAGVEIVAWSDKADAAMRAAASTRR